MLWLLYILLGTAAFLALVILIWLCSMRSNMPWRNCVAMFSNFKLKLSENARNYALGGERDYSTLPQVLKMASGASVESAQEFEARRKEILSLFESQVYGTMPKDGFSTSFETVESGEALNGSAIRKQVKITVETKKGSSEALMLLYIPKTEKPAPVVFGLNFRGNHTVFNDTEILPSAVFDLSDKKWEEKRGVCSHRWNIEDTLARGYAVATIYSADFAPDSKKEYSSRIISLFDEPEFKAVGAWAFGLMRVVDYLVQESTIDSNRIAVVGHSRLGKAAVWAGANDDRIGLVISNDSGNTGASLSRGNHGETVFTINRGFPYWFCSEYAKYGKNENSLPVDQHLLLACVAPRKLYVASAKDDLWADPQGAFNSIKFAKSAFELYGLEALPDDMQTYPPTGEACFCESMAVHMREGWHDINAEDWKFYLDYMDKYFIAV